MKHATDPVCQNDVMVWWSSLRGLHSEAADKRYYFCSMECKNSFDLHPRADALTDDQMRADDDGMALPEQGQAPR